MHFFKNIRVSANTIIPVRRRPSLPRPVGRVHEPPPVLDEYLHDDVGELNVHDGGHGLLLRPEEGGAEADPQVGHGHHVPLRVGRHPLKVRQEQLQHPFVGLREAVAQAVDLVDAILVAVQLWEERQNICVQKTIDKMC